MAHLDDHSSSLEADWKKGGACSRRRLHAPSPIQPAVRTWRIGSGRRSGRSRSLR
jgi:hypothetical protein